MYRGCEKQCCCSILLHQLEQMEQLLYSVKQLTKFSEQPRIDTYDIESGIAKIMSEIEQSDFPDKET